MYMQRITFIRRMLIISGHSNLNMGHYTFLPVLGSNVNISYSVHPNRPEILLQNLAYTLLLLFVSFPSFFTFYFYYNTLFPNVKCLFTKCNVISAYRDISFNHCTKNIFQFLNIIAIR